MQLLSSKYSSVVADDPHEISPACIFIATRTSTAYHIAKPAAVS